MLSYTLLSCRLPLCGCYGAQLARELWLKKLNPGHMSQYNEFGWSTVLAQFFQVSDPPKKNPCPPKLLSDQQKAWADEVSINLLLSPPCEEDCTGGNVLRKKSQCKTISKNLPWSQKKEIQASSSMHGHHLLEQTSWTKFSCLKKNQAHFISEKASRGFLAFPPQVQVVFVRILAL